MAGARRLGPYAPLSATYASDDALIEAGEKAELLFVRGLAFLSTANSDGYITDNQLIRYVGVGMRDAMSRARRLVDVGAWERTEGGYHVRSWLKWNKSAEELGREKKRDRERKSNRNPAQPDDGIQTDSERNPDGILTDSSPRVRGGAEAREAGAPPNHLTALHSTPPKAPQTRSRRKDPATPCPDPMPITEEMRAWAAEHAPDVRLVIETARLVDWARGKDERKVDWVAAWRNWMRGQQEKARPPKGRDELPVSQAWMASNQ